MSEATVTWWTNIAFIAQKCKTSQWKRDLRFSPHPVGGADALGGSVDPPVGGGARYGGVQPPRGHLALEGRQLRVPQGPLVDHHLPELGVARVVLAGPGAKRFLNTGSEDKYPRV